MHVYIAIQNTYEVFEIALFINDKLINKRREDKHNTSKLFIPLLDELLKNNNAKISDFDFCFNVDDGRQYGLQHRCEAIFH